MSDVRLEDASWNLIRNWAVHFPIDATDFIAREGIQRISLVRFSQENGIGPGQMAVSRAANCLPLQYGKAEDILRLCRAYAEELKKEFSSEKSRIVSACFSLDKAREVKPLLEKVTKELGGFGAAFEIAFRANLGEKTVQGALDGNRFNYTSGVKILTAIHEMLTEVGWSDPFPIPIFSPADPRFKRSLRFIFKTTEVVSRNRTVLESNNESIRRSDLEPAPATGHPWARARK